MEKQDLIARAVPTRRHASRTSRLVVAAFITLGFLVAFRSLQFWGWTQNQSQDRPNIADFRSSDPTNPWESITPSPDLEWHSCYEYVNPAFQCARLTVPMDYNDPAGQSCASPKVHIALVLLPAANTTSVLSAPKSPLLVNPGGPGGSGTLLALGLAPALQLIFGSDQPIIGFDPRGIAFTSPRADCWAGPPACEGCPDDVARGFTHRLEWNNMNSVFGGINSSSIALKFINAGHRAVNDLCRAQHERRDGQSILGHATTAHVARDMLSIVDAWEDRVDRQARATGAVQSANPEPNPTKGKLVYWGFSYGTYLGAKFASMFPDRVGRLLLDGVVDAELYETTIWEESLLDTDKILAHFFEYCAEAEKACELYRPGDRADDLSRRYHKVLADLDASPATFIHPEHFFPVILRTDFIKKLVFSVLYSPIQNFQPLATFFNFLFEGKYEFLGPLFLDMQVLCLFSGNPLIGLMTDAQRAVMCGDKKKPVDMEIPEIQSRFEAMANMSEFADIWSELMLQCNGWDIYSPHPEPQRPWATEKQIQTSFPILFLSNTYDPVTPLKAAVKMSLKFKQAGLIEQRSEGHCTISASSRCTAKLIRDYVVDGKVPPPPTVDGDDYLGGDWTKCDADERPWRKFRPEAHTFADDDEAELARAFEMVKDVVTWMMPRWGTAGVERLRAGEMGSKTGGVSWPASGNNPL